MKYRIVEVTKNAKTLYYKIQQKIIFWFDFREILAEDLKHELPLSTLVKFDNAEDAIDFIKSQLKPESNILRESVIAEY